MLQRVFLEPNQRLSKAEILYYITNFDKQTIIDNNDYFKGNNPPVFDRETDTKYEDTGTPNERIPLAYGRKIVTTVSGYMFKPGYITYSSQNENYMAAVNSIFDYNSEKLKTNQLGEQASIQGSGYELHWIEGVQAKTGIIGKIASILTGQGLPKMAIPRFAKIPADEIICLYDYQIEPEIVVAIRFYDINQFIVDSGAFMSIMKVEVYYKDVIQYWEKSTTSVGNIQSYELTMKEERRNFYGMVPIVHYWNNEELLGDFYPVKYLIDAYDTLASDSMNEFDKFAQCYLRLVGMSVSTKDLDKIKVKRIFENLGSPDSVSFLTKDINTEFITFMSDLIRKEIHKQSHIPDFSDEKFAGDQSGIALKYKLFDFENLAAKKEAYFQKGLIQRIKLITRFLDIQNKLGEPEEIEISFKRNLPVNTMEIADISTKAKGTLSQRTILKLWPSDIVKDIDKELNQIRKENEERIDLTRFMDETDQGETTENNQQGQERMRDQNGQQDETQMGEEMNVVTD